MEANNYMIEVNDVSMRFNLGIEKGFSLKQWFVDIGHGKKHEKKDFWALTDVSFKVKKGDVLLLLSDGVLQVEDEDGALPVVSGGNAHTVASAVLGAARERTDCADDMSVCAVRIY